jgi:hypothetical protein
MGWMCGCIGLNVGRCRWAATGSGSACGNGGGAGKPNLAHRVHHDSQEAEKVGWTCRRIGLTVWRCSWVATGSGSAGRSRGGQEGQKRRSGRSRAVGTLKNGVDVWVNRVERWEVLMSGYEQRDCAWKQGRTRERKTAQQVPQDSQGAEKWGGHAGTLIQARGGTDG